MNSKLNCNSGARTHRQQDAGHSTSRSAWRQGTGAEADWMAEYRYRRDLGARRVAGGSRHRTNRRVPAAAALRLMDELTRHRRRMALRGTDGSASGSNPDDRILTWARLGTKGARNCRLHATAHAARSRWHPALALDDGEKPVDSLINFWLALGGRGLSGGGAHRSWSSRKTPLGRLRQEDLLAASRRLVDEEVALRRAGPRGGPVPFSKAHRQSPRGFLGAEASRRRRYGSRAFVSFNCRDTHGNRVGKHAEQEEFVRRILDGAPRPVEVDGRERRAC